MPIQKTRGGFKYGNGGKVFKTKAGAMKQAVAARAGGYQQKPKENKK